MSNKILALRDLFFFPLISCMVLLGQSVRHKRYAAKVEILTQEGASAFSHWQ